jgi:6,7-dimethyl-8-ribityllumazine synthase
MIEHAGRLSGEGRRFGIVVSRFNDFITRPLLEAARDSLVRHGVEEDDIEVLWVPGAWEIPQGMYRLAETGDFSALIALGCVIRGATPHFDYVCSQAASGVSAVGRDTGLPAIFGVLTTDTVEQAVERAGTKAGNKGWDAAMAALEMADVFEKLEVRAADAGA